MSVFVTGDIHADVERLNPEKLKQMGYDLTEKDMMIVLGDFGIPWIPPNFSPEDVAKLQTLDNCPFTVAFVDGNHENFDFLDSLPVSTWNGGKVHRLGAHVVHLMRGEVFTIEDHTYFAFGGAKSIDKQYRKPHLSWWPQEIPTEEEFKHGVYNLAKYYDNSVDYVLTHTIPEWDPHYDDPTCKMLETFYKNTKFKRWFYGHMHKNQFYPELRLYCLYDAILNVVQ